jgi:poly(A) polymerase Pap1
MIVQMRNDKGLTDKMPKRQEGQILHFLQYRDECHSEGRDGNRDV